MIMSRLGFGDGIGGAHIARTMMLDELKGLFSYVNDPEAEQVEYFHAIDEENCLGKKSGQARQLTKRHLVSLYALDPQVPLFRALRFFWPRDEVGRPLLALLCAYARDAVLRESGSFIMGLSEGQTLGREETQTYFEQKTPGRFSPATLKSVAQNVNGSWTRSGHLMGKVKKVRTRPQATAGAMAYALFLSYLCGGRGSNLFASEYVKLLDCGKDRAIELAEEASRRGWIVFKSVGDVIEAQFPKLLTEEERVLIHEQG
jgi:hypothetical protein